MKLGYARVSTEDQRLDLQRARLKDAGCGKLFEEKISGAARARPALEQLLQEVRADDILVVTRLDRLARSTAELLRVAELIREKGAGLQSLEEPWADTTTPAGRMVLTMFAGVAEFERALFDGGRITSDGGVMLLAAAERRIGLADRLAGLIADPRNPLFVTHSVADILRARMLAIACGYEDADDLDHLRTDPGFKLACGRLPDSGRDLCSQPTVSRWENAPTLREVVRLSYAIVDTYCASYAPAACRSDAGYR